MSNFLKRIAASEFAGEDGNAKVKVAAVVLFAAAVLLILAIVFKDQIIDFFDANLNFSVDVETQ